MRIFSVAPFRISLGGGGTDLPSYCSKYGGFVFGVAINMHIDIIIRRPWFAVADKIELHYLKVESVNTIDEVQHTICREALRLTGTDRAVNIHFHSDTPMGTGLGSSGSCAVGLLSGLRLFRGVSKSQASLAEEAFEITQRLGLPDGKQDPYLAALGGFTILEIDPDQRVKWYHPDITPGTVDLFLANTVLFYTGIRRESVEVLRDQNEDKALALKHRTKAIGKQVLAAFERGNLNDFGRLMNEHWLVKREMSDKISSPVFDGIYDVGIKAGALGGKLIGAGGGGYFMFYCPDADTRENVRRHLDKVEGLMEAPLGIDWKGARASVVDL